MTCNRIVEEDHNWAISYGDMSVMALRVFSFLISHCILILTVITNSKLRKWKKESAIAFFFAANSGTVLFQSSVLPVLGIAFLPYLKPLFQWRAPRSPITTRYARYLVLLPTMNWVRHYLKPSIFLATPSPISTRIFVLIFKDRTRIRSSLGPKRCHSIADFCYFCIGSMPLTITTRTLLSPTYLLACSITVSPNSNKVKTIGHLSSLAWHRYIARGSK